MKNDLMRHCPNLPTAIFRGAMFGSTVGGLIIGYRVTDWFLIISQSVFAYLMFRTNYGYVFGEFFHNIAVHIAKRKHK